MSNAPSQSARTMSGEDYPGREELRGLYNRRVSLSFELSQAKRDGDEKAARVVQDEIDQVKGRMDVLEAAAAAAQPKEPNVWVVLAVILALMGSALWALAHWKLV